jgi:outer membrane protein OmpA-like peptidoglycan-associated protein
MKKGLSSVIAGLVTLVAAPFAFGQTDQPGSKDYPGISRMPGYYLSSYSESVFDSYSFQIKEGEQEKQQAVEGHLYRYRYDFQRKGVPASALQIIRNFQNAVRSSGGQVLWDVGQGDERATTLRFAKSGCEVWLTIHAISGVDKLYEMVIVEKQAMQQDVMLDAKAMAHDIGESGRVAIYGIYFDTGKSELKPESEPALAEVAKLLQQNPALKVCIVGHTDMVADFATNMKLSQARAQAVVTALVTKHAIASARLIAFGAGPYAPVASNKTEDGRARNRRVELVEIATK